MAGAYFPITVEAGARFDLVLNYCQPDAAHTRIPLAGFTPVMRVLRNGIVLLSSDAGDLLPGGISLVKNASEVGRVDLSILGDVTAEVLLPYQPGQPTSYTLDLVDDAVPANRIRWLYGPFTQELL